MLSMVARAWIGFVELLGRDEGIGLMMERAVN